MDWMLESHRLLAYLTVFGFVLRVYWVFTQSAMATAKPVRVLPHVVDTLLLLLGVSMVISKGYPFTAPWLLAKFAALLVYIGAGVATMRGPQHTRLLWLAVALAAAGYLFAVAFTRSPLPLFT